MGGSELFCKEWLPLEWQDLGPAPAPGQLAELYAGALVRLTALLGLGDAGGLEPADDATPRAQELVRLEARLNLLMAMVGELLRERRATPPAVPVRLSGQSVVWRGSAPPPLGTCLAVSLHLNPLVPDPVRLPVRVEGVEEGDDEVTVRATFVDLPPPVQNALERLVFRFHRRQVAEQRKTHTP